MVSRSELLQTSFRKRTEKKNAKNLLERETQENKQLLREFLFTTSMTLASLSFVSSNVGKINFSYHSILYFGQSLYP